MDSETTSSTAAIDAAARAGLITPAARDTLRAYLSTDLPDWQRASVAQLVARDAWAELDARFFKSLSFGTGGLRGRSIGKILTDAEQGRGGPGGRPEHPAVGSNSMNFDNVRRATHAVVEHFRARADRVTIAVGFDTRYFSPEFAQCTADAATERGADVLLFDAPVSSPQLAFCVRTRGATAGVMITASHNPPHDNGYKVYLGDGGQILSEDAAAIAALMATAPSPSSAPRGTVTRIGTETDAVFADTIHALALDDDARRGASAARIVYTPLHGTGMRVVPRALARLGCAVTEVASQSVPDGAFPTVASPNPEDPRAYDEGIAIAKTVGADVVIATDPDADRLGVAAREPNGEYRLLSGNQLGAILTAYRLEALRRSGELTPETAHRFVVVKTVVTTELIRAIANHYGVRCVDTLTGFKYIGAKLRGYAALPEPRRLVFAGEESFGYLGDDYVRDKDANGTAVMVADAITAFARDGRTLIDAVDDLHVAHGVFVERLENLTLEGVAGAKRIQEILQELRTAPPTEIAGSRVAWVKDHSTDVVLDEDDQPLPKELMVRLGLEDGSVITVRGSGTEPKLKYYFSARGLPRDHAALAETRAALWDRTGAIWSAMQAAATPLSS